MDFEGACSTPQFPMEPNHPSTRVARNFNTELFLNTYFTAAAAAAILGIHESQLKQWIKDKKVAPKLPPDSTVQGTFVDIVEVYALLKAGGVNKMGHTKRNVAIKDIVLKPECQARVGLRSDVVTRYRAFYEEGAQNTFPITLVEVDSELWLVDGWHRLEAARLEEHNQLLAYVLPGNEKTALQAARRMNTYHGIKLSSQDLHKILVELAVKDPLFRAAIISARPDFRLLEQMTGIGKSSIQRYAVKLLKIEQSQKAAEQRPISAIKVDGPHTPNKSKPEKVEGVPLLTDEITTRLLQALHENHKSLPRTTNEFTLDHHALFARHAALALALINRPRGEVGMASRQVVKGSVRKHPIPGLEDYFAV